MWETSKSILLSRTVWVAVSGVVLAVANMLGYHIADREVTQAIDLLLFVLAGIFRIAATQTLHVTAPPSLPASPDN